MKPGQYWFGYLKFFGFDMVIRSYISDTLEYWGLYFSSCKQNDGFIVESGNDFMSWLSILGNRG